MMEYFYLALKIILMQIIIFLVMDLLIARDIKKQKKEIDRQIKKMQGENSRSPGDNLN